MTTVNHSEVALGARHAIHNLTYADAANRIAGTNEGSSIVLAAANVYQIAKQLDDETLWILLDDSPITWKNIITADVVDDLTYSVADGNVVHTHVAPRSLADDEYFDLPAETVGWGTFMLMAATGSGTLEWLKIAWGHNGAVTVFEAGPNSAGTDSDGDFCAFDNGNDVRIRNRLGSTKLVFGDYHYTQIIVA